MKLWSLAELMSDQILSQAIDGKLKEREYGEVSEEKWVGQWEKQR